jgi:hypothetical protein
MSNNLKEGTIQTVEGAPTNEKPWTKMSYIRIDEIILFTTEQDGESDLLSDFDITLDQFHRLFAMGLVDARQVTVANAQLVNELSSNIQYDVFDRAPRKDQLLQADTVVFGPVCPDLWSGKDNPIALKNSVVVFQRQFPRYDLDYTLPVSHDEALTPA